jgi:hypothetical protein
MTCRRPRRSHGTSCSPAGREARASASIPVAQGGHAQRNHRMLGEILNAVANKRERFLIRRAGIPAAILLSVPHCEDRQDLIDTWYEQHRHFTTSVFLLRVIDVLNAR